MDDQAGGRLPRIHHSRSSIGNCQTARVADLATPLGIEGTHREDNLSRLSLSETIDQLAVPDQCQDRHTLEHGLGVPIEFYLMLCRHLGVERWQVFGGSWGSTLALAYAQSHPERCAELVLRGIFTLRRDELLWFYQEGASWTYPDAWQDYLAPIPESERGDMISAYYKRLTGDDEDAQLRAAKAWSVWEGGTVSLFPSEERMQSFSSDAFAIAFARIECHYFVNGGFFESDDQILANLHKVRAIPAVIVQGRYDVVTPMKTAWEMHQRWPEAEFKIVQDAGHAASEPGVIDALICATNKFAQR